MKNSLLIGPIVLSLAAMTGCGGGGESDTPDIGAAMSAIGGGITSPGVVDKTEVINTNEELPLEVYNTKSLIVADDFTFDTAQSIDIDFDLESARNNEASVSICTAYNTDDQGYDVDYDSCTVHGNLLNGMFTHSMEVTNEFATVIAVVWFQDSGIDPIHREFTVGGSSTDRSVKSVDGRKVIVWR